MRNQGQMSAKELKALKGRRSIPGSRRPSRGARARKRGEKKEKLALGTGIIDRSEIGASKPLGESGGPKEGRTIESVASGQSKQAMSGKAAAALRRGGTGADGKQRGKVKQLTAVGSGQSKQAMSEKQQAVGVSGGPPPPGTPAGGPRGSPPIPLGRGAAKQAQGSGPMGQAGKAGSGPGGTETGKEVRARMGIKSKEEGGAETQEQRTALKIAREGRRAARAEGQRALPGAEGKLGTAEARSQRALPGAKGKLAQAGRKGEQEAPESEFVSLAAGRAVPGGGREGAVFEITRNPSPNEMTKEAPVGRIQTPDYSVVKDKDGKFKDFQWSEAGKVKVEQNKQKMIQKMGKFPGHDDPNSPKPPIEPGEPFFNPYNGTWVQPEGMESESLLDKYGG